MKCPAILRTNKFRFRITRKSNKLSCPNRSSWLILNSKKLFLEKTIIAQFWVNNHDIEVSVSINYFCIRDSEALSWSEIHCYFGLGVNSPHFMQIIPNMVTCDHYLFLTCINQIGRAHV